MDPAMEVLTRGSVTFPWGSELVIDADEEVFLLYSGLQTKSETGSSSFRGLGHVDSKKDVLTITFELKPPADQQGVQHVPDAGLTKKQRRKNSKSSKAEKIPDKIVEIQLAQDKTALRTRKGDTGSVLWRASIDFAQLVLQQVHERTANALFNTAVLGTQHVLELGAGTGFLAVAFSDLVRQYTVTDISALTPLLRKNISLNFDGWPNGLRSVAGSNISVEDVDWVLLHSMPPAQRAKNYIFNPVDVLLIVDCIYHPSLLPALVDTIGYLAIPERTVVLVVVELRAEDVIREFLARWIASGGWQVWRAGPGLLDKPYAIWLGWRGAV